LVLPRIAAMAHWYDSSLPKHDAQRMMLTQTVCRTRSTRRSSEDPHQVPRKWGRGPPHYSFGDGRNVAELGRCCYDDLEDHLRCTGAGQYTCSSISLCTMCSLLLVWPILWQ
jgi:hypothetical protein